MSGYSILDELNMTENITSGEGCRMADQISDTYPEVCLRERYAEDRDVCGCSKCEPQAREDAQPVARAHVRLEDDGLFADLEVLNGEHLQVEHSPVDLFLHPAPDALRAAFDAGVDVGYRDITGRNAPQGFKDKQWPEALAALQAEQKGGAA